MSEIALKMTQHKHITKGAIKDNLVRAMWFIVAFIDTAAVLSLFIDNGKPMIDFLFFITGGDRF